jgi:Protein  of unknown function (DUF3018)
VQRRRDKLRAAGLRPVQIWVPDTRAAGFSKECARQARLIRKSETPERRAEDEAWYETSDTTGWTA